MLSSTQKLHLLALLSVCCATFLLIMNNDMSAKVHDSAVHVHFEANSVATKTLRKTPVVNSSSCGIFFLHIRKAGGTYIGNFLREWLRSRHSQHDCCGHVEGGKMPCPPAPFFYTSKKYANWTCPDFKFVEQEYNFYNPGVLKVPCLFTVTSIRDPVQRIISHFLYEFPPLKELEKKLLTANNTLAKRELNQRLLQNHTLWDLYLDGGAAADGGCPKHLWKRESLTNFLSFAVDPLNGLEDSKKFVEYQNNNGDPLIYQNTSSFIQKLDKEENSVQRCGSRIQEDRMSRSVQRAVQFLSLFSLVLTDVDTSGWKYELSRSLGMNTSKEETFQETQGRSNRQTPFKKYDGIPEQILLRLRQENELDIAIYEAFLQKTAGMGKTADRK